MVAQHRNICIPTAVRNFHAAVEALRRCSLRVRLCFSAKIMNVYLDIGAEKEECDVYLRCKWDHATTQSRDEWESSGILSDLYGIACRKPHVLVYIEFRGY